MHFAEWEDMVRPCIHAAAVRRFCDEDAEARLEALPADVLLEHIEDAELDPDSDSVVMIKTARLGPNLVGPEHLLLSVASPAAPGKLPRAFVSSTRQFELHCLTCKHFRFSCQHVKDVLEAVTVAEDREPEDEPSSQGAMVAVADMLQGFGLRSGGKYRPQQGSAHLPRSELVKVDPPAPGRLGRAIARFRGNF